MRLLFLTPQSPWPAQQGAAMRNAGLIDGLAQSHEIHLLTFADRPIAPPATVASITTVPTPRRSFSRRLAELLTHPEPDMARRLHSGKMVHALQTLLAAHDFDIVQVEGLEMLPLARPHLGSGTSKWVYDAHNAESDLQRSAWRAELRLPRRWHATVYSAIQWRKLTAFERRWLPQVDQVVAVSDEDATLLRKLSGVEPLVLPNGIDSVRTSPDSAAPSPEMAARPGPALLFTGKMDYRPNVDGILWFVDDVLPRLASLSPTLWIVGQHPHPSLKRLQMHPNVVLTGWVESVEPYLAGADVVVVPLRMGSGTRLKVLQALSMARPVVGTSLGCGGLRVNDGEQLALADHASAFANAISSLLADPQQAAAMGVRGRLHVQAHFDWRVLVPNLEATYDRLVSRQA